MKAIPQMQTGGWMSDSNFPSAISAAPKNGAANALEAEQVINKKLVQPVSVNGQLNGCLQGFLTVSYDCGRQQPSIGNTAILMTEQNTVAYAADVTLHPEGLRKAATCGLIPVLIPAQKNSCALESGVEWSKRFSYPLLCALQQVHVTISNRLTSKLDNYTAYRLLSSAHSTRIISVFIMLVKFLFYHNYSLAASILHEDSCLLRRYC